MSLDERARSATDGLLMATQHDVHVPTALDRLHRGRTSLLRFYAVGVAVIVVLLGLGAIRWSAAQSHGTAPPVVEPSPSITPTRVGLAVPFTVELPPGWEVSLRGNVLAVLSGPDGSTIEIVIDPRPVSTTTSPAPRKLDAESFARWIAALPTLWSPTPEQTVVAGYPSWRVDLLFDPVGRATGTCDGPQVDCLPLVRAPGVALPLGIVSGAEGRALVVQLGDDRLLVITVTGGHAMHLADVARTLQPVIDSIAVNVP